MTQLEIGLFETEIKQSEEYLDYIKASHLLGISVATLRNWVKANHIKPTSNGMGKLLFTEKDILNLKKNLIEGDLNRLKSRANKRNSTSTFIPKEYLHDKNNYNKIEHLVNSIQNNDLSIGAIMFLLSLNQLKNADLIINDLTLFNTFSEITFKNRNIKRVITEWFNEYSNLPINKYIDILTLSLPTEKDILGILYQSLLKEGNKAQGGSYYTPARVVDTITSDLEKNITSETLILDPCSGTGQFLLSFSKNVQNPSNLWGYDIDKIAVNIARVNLLLTYPNNNFFPNIYNQNTLETNSDIEFDIVATNPPWGSHFSNDETSNFTRLYPTITSKEAFSYFIVKGLKLLKENGKLCFVLPESILKVKQHSDIREHILEKTSVTKIKHLGNIFEKVLSPVITLSLEKNISKDNKVTIKIRSGKEHVVNQSRFMNNSFYIFDTEIVKEDNFLISKIYQKPHTTLKDNAEWALGIVTGNNKSFLTTIKTSDNESILKGSDIKKYHYNSPSFFVQFNPKKFQQTAPEWKYRVKEKLIYKFISDTLTFGYDDKQTLTLNSANILIPRIENYPVKLVMAMLNSALFQYLYKKQFNTIKVLRGDLEKLPFPQINKELYDTILTLIDKLIKNELKDTEKLSMINKLDTIIFSIFDITNEQAEYIKLSIKK